MKCSGEIVWKLFNDVNRQVIFFFYGNNRNVLLGGSQASGVSNLSAHFGVKRSPIQNQLKVGLIFLTHLAVTQNFRIASGLIITHKFRFAFFQTNPITCFNGCCVAGTVFLLLHLGLKTIQIGG